MSSNVKRVGTESSPVARRVVRMLLMSRRAMSLGNIPGGFVGRHILIVYVIGAGDGII
jgi:hypothetical protein